MPKFPVDAAKAKVIKALQLLGFQIVREREHISMVRDNEDGTHASDTAKPFSDQRSHTQNYLHPVRHLTG
ncbi:hypothetical protein MiSe_37870 [Microseira wollei NIES-4236]|uniref:YcfA family protein n=1 Tax=Microseira wollei NIES-4236 TaxID=2530354 RepID=A0AAV3XHS9_9CYAN|nr:hypothetical protein [Microseira wollei]GET39027.1 hypothetical protein MiSe_37870 [Microseira wollei NIES-4236]